MKILSAPPWSAFSGGETEALLPRTLRAVSATERTPVGTAMDDDMCWGGPWQRA